MDNESGYASVTSVDWRTLVAVTIGAYRDAWLFALSVVLDVEVTGLDLTDRSSETVLALASVVQGDE